MTVADELQRFLSHGEIHSPGGVGALEPAPGSPLAAAGSHSAEGGTGTFPEPDQSVPF